MNFKGHYAYVTGWAGVTVLDIANPAQPRLAGALPLPHFENEDVDLCGNTLIVVNDREVEDLGLDPLRRQHRQPDDAHDPGGAPARAHRQRPRLGPHRQLRQVGLLAAVGRRRRARRGRRPHRPRRAAIPRQVRVGRLAERLVQGLARHRVRQQQRHRLERRRRWRGRLPGHVQPAQAEAARHDRDRRPQSLAYNDFILHNSQRRGKTLLVTEEDYIDTDETPPGGCRGQGKFETWDLSGLSKGAIKPLGTWETELNGMFTGGAIDSKAPVTVNCSSHWFDAKNGIAAVGWYEQGIRFLDYRDPRNITQVGYYIPANGSTWAAYWSPTDPRGEIAYTADAYRGVDVVRIKDGGLTGKKVRAPVRDEWLGDSVTDGFQPHPTFGFICPVRLP
jgi:LVIVD repeat-containing protein